MDYLEYHKRRASQGMLMMVAFLSLMLTFVIVRVVIDIHFARSERDLAALETELQAADQQLEVVSLELLLLTKPSTLRQYADLDEEDSERAAKLLRELNPRGKHLKALSDRMAVQRLREIGGLAYANARAWGIEYLDASLLWERIGGREDRWPCLDSSDSKDEVSGIAPAIADSLKSEGGKLAVDRDWPMYCYGVREDAVEALQVALRERFGANDSIPVTCHDPLMEIILRMQGPRFTGYSGYLLSEMAGPCDMLSRRLRLDPGPDRASPRETTSKVTVDLDKEDVDALVSILERPKGRVEALGKRLANLIEEGRKEVDRLEKEKVTVQADADQMRQEIGQSPRAMVEFDAQFCMKLFLFALVSLVCLLGINAGFKLSRAHEHEVSAMRRWNVTSEVLGMCREGKLGLSYDLVRLLRGLGGNPFSPSTKGTELSTPQIDAVEDLVESVVKRNPA